MTDFDEEAFSFENALLSANVILWEDFTVEHGVGYRYAL
jgi:hypothetical protein